MQHTVALDAAASATQLLIHMSTALYGSVSITDAAQKDAQGSERSCGTYQHCHISIAIAQTHAGFLVRRPHKRSLFDMKPIPPAVRTLTPQQSLTTTNLH